ncbi:MAG TPA: hypothetical protein VFB23_09175 [Candidatus Acidoferrales bacterium]|nr:hypothetical protein [Candidatus Acidoferrales bacterium]
MAGFLLPAVGFFETNAADIIAIVERVKLRPVRYSWQQLVVEAFMASGDQLATKISTRKTHSRTPEGEKTAGH